MQSNSTSKKTLFDKQDHWVYAGYRPLLNQTPQLPLVRLKGPRGLKLKPNLNSFVGQTRNLKMEGKKERKKDPRTSAQLYTSTRHKIYIPNHYFLSLFLVL